MSNKIAVITGGTKGLGRAFCETFAREGFDVFTCSRTLADLEDMKAAWALEFPKVRLLTERADLGSKADVLEFASYIKKHTDQVDVLINNAGVFLPGSISEEGEGSLETMIETNLYSAYHLTRSILPLVTKKKGSHIFNICSIASKIAYPNGGSYSISKFALLGFSKVLREETKPLGIKVTAILPGATWSDSWTGVDLPEHRLMQAEDIAKTVWAAYQLSDSAVLEEVVLRPQLGDL